MNKGIIYLNVSTHYTVVKYKNVQNVYQIFFYYCILGVIELCKL